MVRNVIKMPEVRFGKVRKTQTIPDQSLSIREIVRRYVRGIPVDVVQKQEVYIDQSDADLEKLSRMDFGEKAEYAEMLRQQSAQVKAAFDDKARRLADERKKREQPAQVPPAAEKKIPPTESA